MRPGSANLDVRQSGSISKMLAAEGPATGLTSWPDSRRRMQQPCRRTRSVDCANRGIEGEKDESKQVSHGIVFDGVSGSAASICTNRWQTQGAAKARAGA